MPFEPTKNPFGGVDEDATIEAAAALCGGKHKLEELSGIFKRCHPIGNKTQDQVFTTYAHANGFPYSHIEAFLVLTRVA